MSLRCPTGFPARTGGGGGGRKRFWGGTSCCSLGLTASPSRASGASAAAAQQAPEKEDVGGQHHELGRGKHQQQQQQEEEPGQHLCPVQSGTCKHPVSILSSFPGVEGRAPSLGEWLRGEPQGCLSEPPSPLLAMGTSRGAVSRTPPFGLSPCRERDPAQGRGGCSP